MFVLTGDKTSPSSRSAETDSGGTVGLEAGDCGGSEWEGAIGDSLGLLLSTGDDDPRIDRGSRGIDEPFVANAEPLGPAFTPLDTLVRPGRGTREAFGVVGIDDRERGPRGAKGGERDRSGTNELYEL